MQYHLRTLLIVLALGPPLLAGAWFTAKRYRAWQQRDMWEDVGGPGAISGFSAISCTLYAEETVDDEQVLPADDSDD